MRKREFIDAIYASGWRPDHDAQWTNITDVWRKCFPTAAAIHDEIQDLIETAHMAGQQSAGVDPSFSIAQQFVKETTTEYL